MFASTAYEKLGKADKAKFHHDVASAFLRSIFTSGDGKTKETAFEVASVAEEYVVVMVMGLPRIGNQSLISGKPPATISSLARIPNPVAKSKSTSTSMLSTHRNCSDDF